MTRSTRVQLSRLSLALVAAMAMAPAFAQSTSSGVAGTVTGADGSPVAGAEVTITHVESGTVSRATTDAGGRYVARGLRVGGPYTIAIHAAAGDDTESDVYLPLDKVATVDAQLGGANAGNTLDTITVTATRSAPVFNPDNKGLGTNINQRELKALPTPSRSIQDVARLDPRITVTDRGDGSMSSMGQNSRYNSISVDGVGQGDPFGLNSNGMPYLGSPISVDTIEEYNLSTANYDVTSNVIGASINAVTKSGTNDFHGSVYYAYRNADDFVGNLNDNPYTAYDKDSTAGFTLGGPILKDKLFFFVNYEETKTTGIGADSANALDPGLGNGPSTSNKVSPGDLQRIIDAATALGLKPGTFTGGGVDLEDKRYLAKLDWNINDYHRASLTHQRTKETQPVVQGNSSTSVGLSSYWYTKNSDTKNTVLQFFDDWTENFSTEAKLSTSHFKQARSVDDQQPQVFINLGSSSGLPNGGSPFVNLGEDQFSHYNVLDVKTIKAYFAGTWYVGDHEIKGGFDYQRNKIYNLFGRTQFGAYTFWGIDNFEDGIYNQFQIYQPAPGQTIDDVAAEWTLGQTGLFLQDTWQASEGLSLQYGVRYDRTDTGDSPVQNGCFGSAPNPAGTGPSNCKFGGFGFTNTNTIDGKSLIEPRFSFNYTMPDRKYQTQFRGGIGLFQSNPPTVWMTNPYQNNGMTTATYSVFNNCGLTPNNDYQTCGTSSVYLPEFSPDPFGQNIPPGASSQMNVDTISDDFKLPSAWKASFAWDQELPWWGTVFSAEWQVMKVKDAIYYQNLNIGAPTGVLPDGRNTYYKDPSSGPSLIDPVTGAVVIGSNGKTISNGNRANANPGFSGTSTLLTNTDKGGAHSVTLLLKKPLANGWYGSLGFTFGDATEVNPGTSSQASSNFSNNAWVNPNEEVASRSNYAIRRRVNAALTWEHRFFGDYATGVGAFYDGHTGTPYSWVFGNDANGDSYSADLAYIPATNDAMVTFAPGTTATQIQQFYDFIKSDDYLSGHEGGIAKRNGATSGWINQVDLSFRQEVPGFFKGNKGEIRLDIFNFLNMLNSDWGQQQYVGFPYRRNLANFVGVDSNGKMIYQLPTDKNGNYAPGSLITYDAGRDVKTNVVSRWSALLTLRYTF